MPPQVHKFVILHLICPTVKAYPFKLPRDMLYTASTESKMITFRTHVLPDRRVPCGSWAKSHQSIILARTAQSFASKIFLRHVVRSGFRGRMRHILSANSPKGLLMIFRSSGRCSNPKNCSRGSLTSKVGGICFVKKFRASGFWKLF